MELKETAVQKRGEFLDAYVSVVVSKPALKHETLPVLCFEHARMVDGHTAYTHSAHTYLKQSPISEKCIFYFFKKKCTMLLPLYANI